MPLLASPWFLSSFDKFDCAIEEKKSEKVSANQRLRWPFLPERPEKHNLVQDAEFLLPVKFRQNPFSVFRDEVKS